MKFIEITSDGVIEKIGTSAKNGAAQVFSYSVFRSMWVYSSALVFLKNKNLQVIILKCCIL